MIDHIGFAVSDLPKAKLFYRKALQPLGIGLLTEVSAEQTGKDAHAGFGTQQPFFWIGDGKRAASGVHVAFRAESRALVEAFYRAALDAGGQDNGPPGVRAHFHENYYAAFVLDPDGNNIEAVCHQAI